MFKTQVGLGPRGRLMMVSSDRIPADVVDALQSSPINVETVGANLLGSGDIAAGDCIVVGEVAALDKVVSALSKKKALSTPIVAIGQLSEVKLDDELLKRLRLTILPKSWEGPQLVKRIMQLVLSNLKSVEDTDEPDFELPGFEQAPKAPQPLAKPPSDVAPSNDTVAEEQLKFPKPAPLPTGVGSRRLGGSGAQRSGKQLRSEIKQPRADKSKTDRRKPAQAAGRAADPLAKTALADPGPQEWSSLTGARPKKTAPVIKQQPVEPKDTPPTQLSLKAPQALRQIPPPSVTINQFPAVRPEFDILPQPPPSSHRRMTSRPPAPAVVEQVAVVPAAPVEAEMTAPAPAVDHAVPAVDYAVSPPPPSAVTMQAVAPQSLRHFSQAPMSMAPDGRTLRATRWVVVDDNEARVQAVATCLRQLGAKVETMSLSNPGEKLARVRALDAIGYLIDERDLRSAPALLKSFEQDPRLRWMRLVALRWGDLFDEETAGVVTETLTRSLELHWETEWETLEQLLQGREIAVERLGMARILVAASRASGSAHVQVSSAGHYWGLELAAGALVGLSQDGVPVAPAQLYAVFEQLMLLSSGTVSLVEQSNTPAKAIIAVRELLRLHAERVAAQPAYLGEEFVAPVVQAAKQLKPPLPSHRLLDSARFYRLPLVAGVATTLLSVGLITALSGSTDDAAQASEAAPPAQAAAPAPKPKAKPVVQPAAKVAVAAAPQKPAPPLAAAKPVEPAPVKVEAQAETPPPQDPPDDGVAAVDSGELRTPSKSCEHLLAKTSVPRKRHPGQAESAWHLARKSLMLGDIATAEEQLCLSAHLDPQGQGTIALIRLYFMQDELANAKGSTLWAMEQRPDDPTVKQLLADSLNHEGDIAGARKLLMDSMNILPHNTEVLQRVSRRFAYAGHKVLKGGDPAQAERMFLRSTALDADNLLATTGLAELLLKRNELEGAARYAVKATQLEPRSFQAQFLLGEVLSAKGDREAAVKAYRVALQLNPGSFLVKKRLGLL